MNHRRHKIRSVVGSILLLVGMSLVGCMQKGESTQNVSVEQTKSYSTVKVDELVEVGTSLFETIYEEDALKAFKLDFAQHYLELVQSAVRLLPTEINQAVYTLEEIDQSKVNHKVYHVKAVNKETDRFRMTAEIDFLDDAYAGRAVANFYLTFNLYEEEDLILSPEAQAMIELLIQAYTADEIEGLLNMSLKNEETIYLIEGGEEQVTIAYSKDETNKKRVRLGCQFAKPYPET